MTPEQKLLQLEQMVRQLGSALLAFSGGVDSTFLLAVTREVLGENLFTATVDGKIHARSEMDRVREMVAYYGVRHFMLEEESLLERQDFLANPPDRCRICKEVMVSRLKTLARQLGVAAVIDGSNAADLKDYRPGMQVACAEGVISPLLEAGLHKEDIRFLAKRSGVPVWNEPSSPCLCSRIPYGQPVTPRKLMQVEKGESLLHQLGFRPVRLRHHGDLARIEVDRSQQQDLFVPAVLEIVNHGIKKLGFKYVTVALDSFCSGSLNDGIA